MSHSITEFLKEVREAMKQPTYAKVHSFRKRLMQASAVLGVDGYRILSAEVDKLSVMASIRDAERWMQQYQIALRVLPTDQNKLLKCAFWSQNACQSALQTLSRELLLQANEMVSGQKVRYNIKVAKHPDLLMARTREILHALDEDESHFTDEGALMLMLAYIHLGALRQLHSQ